MTSKKGPPRPPAVMSACLFVGLSSALLLIYVVGWLTSWNSLDMQDLHADIADAIGTSDVARVADVMRGLLLVLVVVLVTGVVGAIYTARGHLGSRILITIVAAVTALVFAISGGVLGLLPAVFAVAAIVQLWGRDPRRWFALVNGREVPAEPVAAARPPVQPGPGPQVPPPPGQDWSLPPGQVRYPPPGAAPPARGRPSSVSTTILVTIIASAAALGGSLLYLLIYTTVPHDDLVQTQMDSPVMKMIDVSEAEIRQALTTSAVLCGVVAALSVAAIVAAWAFGRRSAAAHTALFVLAVVTIVVGVLSIVGIPWAGTAIWTLVLLRKQSTLMWLRSPS